MTKSDSDMKKLAVSLMAKLKRAAVTLDSEGFPVYSEDVRTAAEFIRTTRINVAGDIDSAVDLSPPESRSHLSEDMVVFHSGKVGRDICVDDILADVHSVAVEMTDLQCHNSATSLRAAADLVTHLMCNLSTLKENVKGFKSDSSGMLAELKELRDEVKRLRELGMETSISQARQELAQARETITQLQSVGERAEELRKENHRLAHELCDLKEKLSLRDRKIDKLLDIADNLAQVLDKSI